MEKPYLKLALLSLSVSTFMSSAFAASTAELTERLEEQESKLRILERQLQGSRGAIRQNRDRLADMAERLRINGFFSGGVAVNDGDDLGLAIYGIDDDYSSSAVSRLGIQMTFQVSDDMTLTGQLVSRGVNDYEVVAEWAYLSWDVNPDFTLRLGRQRLPYYLLSEYLEVGYAYPWVRPPIELYNIPISSVDGAGILHDFALGDWNFTTQAYIGSSSGFADQLEGEFTQQEAWGVAFFAESGPWTLRLGFSTSNLDVDNRLPGGIGDRLLTGLDALVAGLSDPALASLQPVLGDAPVVQPIPLENIGTHYVSGALSFDNGSLLVMAELANLRVEDFVQPAGDGGYLTVGYRMGRWLPHVTWGKFYTDSSNNDQIRAYLDGALYLGTASAVAGNAAGAAASQELYNALSGLIQRQTSYTLGVTYDVNPRVKAKLEAAFYTDMGRIRQVTAFDASGATFDEVDGNGRFTGAPGASGGDTAIFSFAIDAVF